MNEYMAYKKVLDTIHTANYHHFFNGSLENLINNFFNMYKDKDYTDKLWYYYNYKIKLFES
jgi:hypothetical protein